jgi:signal transduction histidine kinase
MNRRAPALVALAALLLTAVPLVPRPPANAGQWVGALALVAGGCLLAGWRSRPGLVAVAGPLLLLVPGFLGLDPPDTALVLLLAYAALIGERFGGRTAWVAGLAAAGYLALIYAVSGETSPALIILTVPGYLAGTALRLRRQTAEALAARARDLEQERELFAEVSVRNERARIASELHDIVGHTLSVMVVHAAAGQRLLERGPDAARESLAVIAESARQGRADLQRLIEILSGGDAATPDLALVDEVVARAAGTGLKVTCRFEGDRDGVSPTAAHIAFRVVQEGLTNALRHAPGAAVQVLVRGATDGRALTVRVENDAPPEDPRRDLRGSGRGLQGLRERVLAAGGSFAAGPRPQGGWQVEACLDPRARQRAEASPA